ncbi:hypothetical protein Bca101_025893 [Brassica carinata]
MEVRDSLRSGHHWWTFFTRKRVCKTIRLAHPEFGMETDSDSEPVDRVPERVPAKKSDDWFSKDKGIDIGDLDFSVDDFDLPGWDPNLAFGDGSGSSDMPLPDFDTFFDGLPANPDPPPFVEEPERPEIIAESSRAVNGDKYKNLRAADVLTGDFCECRGSVGTLLRIREGDYVYEDELNLMKEGMKDCAHAESLVPPIEGRIWGLWDPIPVSPDMVEVATEADGGKDEVSYPAGEFGASPSEDFVLY